MPLDFEKDGIKFHAENGWAKAEKDGKELWRSLDVFKDNPPTEELVLGLHRMITDSWYLREEEDGKRE
jgi:hypothetical protein